MFLFPVFASVIFTVSLDGEGFYPDRLEINQADTVVFQNVGVTSLWPASNIHPTHEIYPELDPRRPIAPGESWEFKFDKAGIWRMHDHLYSDLTGTIIVRGEEVGEEVSKNEGIKNFWEGILEQLQNFFSRLRSLIWDWAGQVGKAKTFHQPETYLFDVVYNNTLSQCKESEECFVKALDQITLKHGPEASLKVLAKLQEDKHLSGAVDDHHLAHEIGRKTAEGFGVNGEAFLLCPTIFNYGCQHGFFEAALGKLESSASAAQAICQTIEANGSYSAKFKAYCYHGLGHGVMMSQANDLLRALAVCDSLETDQARGGCWQGVFMENVNAKLRGEAREAVFSSADPLEPCSRLEEKYRHECFINHAGWLMNLFSDDLEKAALACLKAPANYIASCLQSIGLMVSNPSWQPALLGQNDRKSFEADAWELCLRFPNGFRDQCVIGAVDNILNFDELEVERSQRFCQTADIDFRNLCYQRIGMSLRLQAMSLEVVVNKCQGFGDDYQRECLRGAGLWN